MTKFISNSQYNRDKFFNVAATSKIGHHEDATLIKFSLCSPMLLLCHTRKWLLTHTQTLIHTPDLFPCQDAGYLQLMSTFLPSLFCLTKQP